MGKKVIYSILITFIIIASLFTVFAAPNFDLNGDGSVTVADISSLAQIYRGKGTYNASYDFNNDSEIDLFDLVRLARNVSVSINLAPGYGDDPFDILIWQEDFESYENTSELESSSWLFDGSISNGWVSLDPTGGESGSVAMQFDTPTGGEGPFAERSLEGTYPNHTFVSFKVKFQENDEYTYGKWFILRHDMDTYGNTDGCGGNQILRYQWGLGRYFNATVSFPTAKPGIRFEENTSCNGPIGEDYTEWIGYYVWPGAPSPITLPPILSQDADIGNVPWNPLNDGNWHTFVYEIKIGNGTEGYQKFWYDDYLMWDSSSGPMNFPGRPTVLFFEDVSGQPKLYNTTRWYDNITVWRRS